MRFLAFLLLAILFHRPAVADHMPNSLQGATVCIDYREVVTALRTSEAALDEFIGTMVPEQCIQAEAQYIFKILWAKAGPYKDYDGDTFYVVEVAPGGFYMIAWPGINTDWEPGIRI